MRRGWMALSPARPDPPDESSDPLSLAHCRHCQVERIAELEIPTGVPLVYDLDRGCIQLLDDGLAPSPRARYDFGAGAELLFQVVVVVVVVVARNEDARCCCCVLRSVSQQHQRRRRSMA